MSKTSDTDRSNPAIAGGLLSPSNREALRFVVIFSVLLALLHAGYNWLPDEYLIGVLIHTWIAEPCATLIRLFSDQRIYVLEATVYSPQAAIEIVRGCDGSGSAFLLIAAIVALGANLWRTLVGLLLGMLLIYVLNTIRIVSLFFVVAHRPELFTTAHTLVAPTFIVLLGCLFFLVWGLWSLAPRVEEATASGG